MRRIQRGSVTDPYHFRGFGSITAGCTLGGHPLETRSLGVVEPVQKESLQEVRFYGGWIGRKEEGRRRGERKVSTD